MAEPVTPPTPPTPPSPPSNIVPVNIQDEMRRSYVDYAMRYTEARMTAVAEALLEDIDKDTVDFVPNYDEDREEPSYLPSRIPNLLVNGSGGIAVGMATNMPPHNLTEVCEALIQLMSNPLATLADMTARIQGPDFP